MKVAIYVLCLTAILSCTCHTSYQENEDWTKDSIGTLNLRSKELAEKIIKEHSLYRKCSSKFICVFGKPNCRETTLFTDKLIYIERMGGDFIPNANRDTCFISFNFKMGRFVGIDESCE